MNKIVKTESKKMINNLIVLNKIFVKFVGFTHTGGSVEKPQKNAKARGDSRSKRAPVDKPKKKQG